MSEKLYVDWRFVGLTVLILGAPLALRQLDIDPRFIGWQLAALAAFGLTVRLVGWFRVTPTGMRMMAFLLIITLLLSAIGQYFATKNGSPITWVTYALISQRLACIGVALYWPRWTDTKTSPFLREVSP